MSLEALLFDVDGTLADTEEGHRVAFNMAFAKAGLDWNWTEALYGQLLAVTGGKERIGYYLDSFNTEFDKPENLSEFIANLHQSKTDYYTALLFKGEIPLRPGVERLINEARAAGLRLAIVTTTTPANVEALLLSTLGEESESWFEIIAAGNVVPAKKPAADIYTYTLDEMKISADKCIALEDSFNGIQSAQGAGVRTLITVNGYTNTDDFSGAVAVLSDLGEPTKAFEVIAGDKTLLEKTGYINIDLLKQMFE